MADATLTRRQRWNIAAAAIATVVVVLGIIAAVYMMIQHQRAASQATVTIHVLYKRADCPTTSGTTSCTWRIYTDVSVFADRDEVTAHKLNSQTLFDQLMYGGVYEVEMRGARHDNIGQYPNIIKIVKVISQGHPNPAVVIATTNA